MSSNFKDGSVKIADEVLDQIAIQAANDVYGVYEDNTDDGFIHSLASKATKSSIKNVGGNLVIDLDLSLDKNVNVRKTVKKIQENVKNVVETMTGLIVSRVNININKLEI
ncbi:Asp23/Gls24 family envelope stress response protein [uncultured Anaerococcus sp.]|uniref:Asp23/Gls24 family envelope stress response protein n=1 Tax=uncultured Anaerococcus sp. TaxID=293428 RepID=UPI00288BAC79|nr:Asp23/Gls24 family envelope stress response protein [uncultured Anaerococcus sp.]